VFSANHPPRSEDASHAFFRRWLVVPFDCTIDPTKAIPRPKLDAMLAVPSELSGVLNKAVDALVRIEQRGLMESESMRSAWNEFRATTDPVSVWLASDTVTDAGLMVAKADLLAAYNRDAISRGRPTLTGKAFGSALIKLRRDVREAQRTIASKPKTWVWLGIGLATQSDSLRDSRDSRDSPYLVPHDAREC
jgi:putative DNA primase/helicase